MRKLFPHPYLSVTLFVAWILLVNRTALGTTLMALVLATALPHVTAAYWPGRAHIRRPLALARYVALVLWDVLTANIHVARLILFTPADQLQSAWISVPVDLQSPEALALLAGTITLTPGTLTAEFSADSKTLLIHALHAPNPDAIRDDIKSRYEARLKRIFA